MRKHIRYCSLIILVLSFLGMASVSRAQSFTLTDSLGREVHFDAPPQRIVLTGRAFFMIADALYLFPGVEDRIAAMGIFRQGPTNFITFVDRNAAQKTVLKPNAGAEQVAAYHPDAVILKSYLANQVGSTFDALGIPVVYLDLETPAQYERDLRILGELFGQPERAEELARYYQDGVARIQAEVGGLDEEQKPSILLLYYSDKDGVAAFQIPPLSWMQTQQIELAGGVPVWRDTTLNKGWTSVSLEQIVAWDADKIFIVSYFKDEAEIVREIQADPTWSALRAVREGKLYAFAGDFNIWDQPNPRWILGLTWLATKLHPARFANLDIIALTRDFYQTLYGLDAENFETRIRPTFKGNLP